MHLKFNFCYKNLRIFKNLMIETKWIENNADTVLFQQIVYEELILCKILINV